MPKRSSLDPKLDVVFALLFGAERNRETERLTKDFELHVLELPKLHLAGTESHERAAVLWGKFLRAESDVELDEIAMDDAALKKAKEALEVLSANPEARAIVEHREMGLRLYHNDLAVATAKGKAQGITEGKAQGITEGLATAIVAVLSARSISVDQDTDQRVHACHDAELLKHWLAQAAIVTSAPELFA